jgi:hypothetical protein
MKGVELLRPDLTAVNNASELEIMFAMLFRASWLKGKR